MSRQPNKRIPKLCQHKASGRALVTLNGKDFYLGAWGSPEAPEEYNRLIAEWLANGRCLPRVLRPGQSGTSSDPTINELLIAYWQHCKTYYVKNGQPSSEQPCIRSAMRFLKSMYGDTLASEFGPLALKAVRESMIQHGLARNSINKNITRLKIFFRWATENEMVPASIHHGLLAVRGLKRGRSEAIETDPIKPVPDDRVDQTIAFVSPHVGAMIQIQRLTGMRSGEMVIMRTRDIDTTGNVWIYTPSNHKTEHHDIERKISIGPRAQAFLRPWFKTDLNAFIFSPVESEALRNAERRANRQSPLTPSQALRVASANPKRTAGERYTTDSYRRAIDRGCDLAFPAPEHLQPQLKSNGKRETKTAFMARLSEDEKAELKAWRKENRWHPHQLRHNCATLIRKEIGIEAARVVLGHRSAEITEIYAEMDHTKATDVMAKIG